MAGVLAFKLAVRDILFQRLKSVGVEQVSNLANNANNFIKYCAEYFPTDKENAYRCAVGILTKMDNQTHPERYKTYNMDSMFDVRLCAGRVIRREDELAISQIETDILNELGK